MGKGSGNFAYFIFLDGQTTAAFGEGAVAGVHVGLEHLQRGALVCTDRALGTGLRPS